MDLARLGRIGSLQDGLITRDQALGVLAKNQIQRLLNAGVLEAPHAAVYRFNAAPKTWRQRARAATMTCSGTKAVASHMTAAHLWGLIDWEPAEIEVLVPFGRSPRLRNALVHRTRHWHSRMLTRRNGIQVTSAARTLIDMSAVCNFTTLKRALDTAIVTRVVSLEDICAELTLIGTRGRRRCAMLARALLPLVAASEKTQSLSEIGLLELLAEHGLPQPIPQYPVALSPTKTAFPDFVYVQQRIVIEMQSYRWHGGPSKFEEDIARKNALRGLGFTIIEFSAKTPPHEIVAVIKAALKNAA